MIKDYFGNEVSISKEEMEEIKIALEKVQMVQKSYYPEDGSQDHIDHHIYGEQRACVSGIEAQLEEKYGSSFFLY